MASLFEAYITNLGKYNEGELVGETLKFPTTTEEVQGLLKRIGVDGVRYEEFFITSFDGDVLGLYDYLTEYENLDELNHLACLLSELDQGDLEKFEAVIDSGEHTSSVADLINLAQNLDCYEFYPGVEDDETLGRIYVEDMEANPMDIQFDLDDDESPLSMKADFLLSLCELVVGGKDGLQPIEKTVIDRCVRLIYRDMALGLETAKTPLPPGRLRSISESGWAGTGCASVPSMTIRLPA